MAEDADSEYQKLLWDAALESMGRDTVRVRLNNMPADRSAAFKLPGQRSCMRGYAEDWLGRGDAERESTGGAATPRRLLDHGPHRCARHCGRCRCVVTAWPGYGTGSSSPAPFLPPANPDEGHMKGSPVALIVALAVAPGEPRVILRPGEEQFHPRSLTTSYRQLPPLLPTPSFPNEKWSGGFSIPASGTLSASPRCLCTGAPVSWLRTAAPVFGSPGPRACPPLPRERGAGVFTLALPPRVGSFCPALMAARLFLSRSACRALMALRLACSTCDGSGERLRGALPRWRISWVCPRLHLQPCCEVAPMCP